MNGAVCMRHHEVITSIGKLEIKNTTIQKDLTALVAELRQITQDMKDTQKAYSSELVSFTSRFQELLAEKRKRKSHG